MSITFVTTKSYGTWLPGATRGYVRKGELLPGDPLLLELSRNLLKSRPVYFTQSERLRLFAAMTAACTEFKYRLSDATIESWHLHWILFHNEDPIKRVVGRLKTRMRQALARGKIWTKGYCAEPLFDNLAIGRAQEYIAHHNGCMMLDGRALNPKNPRQSRGLSAAT
jgi:REP element-mobilizing transposase RayT